MAELPSHEFISSLAEKASTVLENETASYRPADMNGKPGSLLELDSLPAIIVPDLHARPYFIEHILNYSLSYDFCGADNYVFKKITVEQALEEKLVNLICVGDAIHTELTADRWLCIENEFAAGKHCGTFMKAEMQECLSTLCAVMNLKCKYRDNFHFLKGNHENILNETAGGDFAFCKYADEGEMVKTFISDYYGDDVLYLISCWEKALPLVACGSNYVVSHAEPMSVYTRRQLIDARYDSEVVSGLIWTRNGQVKKNTAEGIIKNLLPSGNAEESFYFAGHRPVYEKYALRQNGRFIQIHNTRCENIALVSNKKVFDPDTDIISVENGSAK